MAATNPFDNGGGYKPKSFWKRPEGVTGALVLGAGILGGGYLLYMALPFLIGLAANALTLTLLLIALAGILYMVFDPKVRALVWYGYKGIMRKITGMFVQLDPIGILKSYVDDLQNNLTKMSKQIGNLRGQMRKMKNIIDQNSKDIQSNMQLADKAKRSNQRSQMILKVRKAGRLKESNVKLEELYKKMEVLYRVLTKMYQNSEILLEDVKDQVQLKEQERKAIRASHSAMKSAMNVISGNNDKRIMFDQAMEAIADDVANKVGEMERFMDISSNFMDSIDLKQGVFEEEGMKMLEQWEKESESLLLGDEKDMLLLQAENDTEILDLNSEPEKIEIEREGRSNQYNNLFDEI